MGCSPLSEYAVILSCLIILAITTYFKPMAGNDAIASDPFARSSIAGTTSWVREVVGFRSYSYALTTERVRTAPALSLWGEDCIFHLHKAPARERQVQLKSIGVSEWLNFIGL